jgi:hypothetical protein
VPPGSDAGLNGRANACILIALAAKAKLDRPGLHRMSALRDCVSART